MRIKNLKKLIFIDYPRSSTQLRYSNPQYEFEIVYKKHKYNNIIIKNHKGFQHKFYNYCCIN